MPSTMPTQRDYYEVLGVEQTATVVEIKSAYKKIAVKNHPDRNPGDEEATARFKEASEAYAVLSDEDKRARYDRFGHAGVQGGAGGFQDVGDIFESFGDLFGGLFGGAGGRRSRGGGRRGDSLRTSITIDLHEAARGCTRDLEIPRREPCGTCGGNGAKPGTEPVVCDYCGGSGQVVQSQGFFRMQTTCPNCGGTGKVIREKCIDCTGTGRIRENVTLEVTVPPGVDNGMQLQLRGEGEAGTGGGPRGDLFVDVRVKKHPLFDRDGDDLHCRIPVSYTQAVLGATVEVPTLDGKQEVEIKPGTQPESVIRLRGEGMPDPHGRGRGDLNVHVQLEVPKKVSGRHEELLRELAEIEHVDVMPHRKTWFERVTEYFTGGEEE